MEKRFPQTYHIATLRGARYPRPTSVRRTMVQHCLFLEAKMQDAVLKGNERKMAFILNELKAIAAIMEVYDIVQPKGPACTPPKPVSATEEA